jgi:CheY-like chemotaxis protein
MRGRIEIVSTSRLGTRFAVVLPRRPAPPPRPVAPAGHANGERLRILVVDDEVHVRLALKSLLASDHEVEAAADGEAALALVGAAPFDVILCDLMMPRMSGREVYEQIRKQWPGLERRIVFVTGGAFIPSLASFLESVDNLKLRKPFTIEQVLEQIHEARRRA